jgi:hypothetical protein
VRAQIDVEVKHGSGSWQLIQNDTIPEATEEYYGGHNVIYNETEIRETHLVVNGKNRSANPWHETHIKLTGHRCVGSCVEEVDFDVEEESEARYWSDVTSWPNETLPAEGEDVHIEPGWNMIYDLEGESPIYQLVRVNGKLSFKEDMDLHFRAKHIFIRGGEMALGTAEAPLTNSVTITLVGEKNAETMVYDNAVEAGNKVIAVTGKLSAYGIKREESRMSRLLQPAQKGDTSFFVDTGLDWVAGDRLALLPTSYKWDAWDEVFVDAYDAETGEVTATSALDYYHFGQAESTGDLYDGLDIRGEVILLTRNVRIQGEDIESWGGQIVAGFFMEEDATFRYGQVHFDNIELYNMSQIDTFKAAIRWENNAKGHSSVTNCAFHNGYGWAVNVKTSANVLLKDNVIWNFRPVGLGVQTSSNVTVDGNVVGKIVSRTTFAGQMLLDKEGAFSICAYNWPDPCEDISVTNNIAGGVVYGGFLVPGHDCG